MPRLRRWSPAGLPAPGADTSKVESWPSLAPGSLVIENKVGVGADSRRDGSPASGAFVFRERRRYSEFRVEARERGVSGAVIHHHFGALQLPLFVLPHAERSPDPVSLHAVVEGGIHGVILVRVQH